MNYKYKRGSGNIHPADKYAGRMLQKYRKEAGYTLKQLAGNLQITFQQLQKYENGKNRMSISRLHDICYQLSRDPQEFFKGKR